MAGGTIQGVKVRHLQSGAIHYYNLGTWNHHQKIQNQSGVKIYKVIQMIYQTASTTSRSLSTTTGSNDAPVSRGINNIPPPPKKKKKGCNC